MLGSVFIALIDMMAAAMVTVALISTLPVLTLGSISVVHYFRSPHTDASAEAADGSRNTDEEASSTGPLATSALLFIMKGVLLFLVLIQGSVQLGGAAACWLCGTLIEFAVQVGDSSFRVLTEPQVTPIDIVFFLFVAPALCAPAAGVHGLAAALTLYLCAAFFWRASPSSSLVLPMSLAAAAYLFAWGIGVFEWRYWMASFGLTPAEESMAEAALLAAGVALVHLIPTQSRLAVMPVAIAFSPTFREGTVGFARTSVDWLSRISALGSGSFPGLG